MLSIPSLYLVGFVAAVLLGSQAYFRGELSKPIHLRNWQLEGFQRLAAIVFGDRVDGENCALTPHVEAALARVTVDR